MTRKEFDKKFHTSKDEKEQIEASLEYIYSLEEKSCLAQTSDTLLNFFMPLEFKSSEALRMKAKELDCIPFNDADDICCLHDIGGRLYKEGRRLFYFKKEFSKEELELLVYCYDYKEVYGEPNIFIHGNHNTGVLYVVENIKS